MDQGVGSGAQEDHLNLSIPFSSGLPDVAMKHWNRVLFNRFLNVEDKIIQVCFSLSSVTSKSVFLYISKIPCTMYCNDYLYFSCAIQCPLRRMQDEYIAKQVQVKTIQACCTHTHSAGGGGDRSTQTTMNSNLAASDVPQPGGGRGHSHPHNHHLLHSHLNLHFVFCKQYWVVQSNHLYNRHRQHYFVKKSCH